MDSNVRRRNANKKLAYKAPTKPACLPDEVSRQTAASYSRCPALALPLCRKSYLEAAREGRGLTQIPRCPRLLLLLPVSPRLRCCARAWRSSSAQRRPAPATEHSTRGGRHQCIYGLAEVENVSTKWRHALNQKKIACTHVLVVPNKTRFSSHSYGKTDGKFVLTHEYIKSRSEQIWRIPEQAAGR